jgi:YHS domain-containing protein
MPIFESLNKNYVVKAIDPVCGMTVEPKRTNLVSTYQGRDYWFCEEACRRAFEANPQKYLVTKPAKKKGWIRRYLDRIAKSNEEV